MTNQTVCGQYIAGQATFNDDSAAKTLAIINPALDETIGTLQFATKAQQTAIVDSAGDAFTGWSTTSPLKRAHVLFKFKALLEAHTDELAKLISIEHGKTYEDACGEISRGIEVVEQNCAIAQNLCGHFSENVGGTIDCHTMRQPLGICAGVSPFNFPVMVPLWMMIPAIACGNSFILKPSEQTPSAPLRLAELLTEAGLPDGVVSILQGDKEAVDYLLHAPEIQAITAVASTPVAEYIYHTACLQGKRSHTFGGAKNHCLVMPDADVDFVSKALSGAAFGAAGERCMALSVAVVVGDSTADNLVDKLSAEIKTVTVGPGLDKGVDMGPLINQAHLDKVTGYIQTGLDEGATLVADGRKMSRQPGYFLGPSLFDKVQPSMRIYLEEIFGPVLCIVRVGSFEEGLSLINQHQYGNGTAIFTHDGHAAREFSNRVQVGMVGVNIPIPVPVAHHPFGGWKRSAFGDNNMHGHESLHFYTKLKTVTTRWPRDSAVESNYTMPVNS